MQIQFEAVAIFLIVVYPIILNIEPKMVSKFWALSPISSKHMSLWFNFFLDPHLATHDSNIGLCWRWVTKIRPSYLLCSWWVVPNIVEHTDLTYHTLTCCGVRTLIFLTSVVFWYQQWIINFINQPYWSSKMQYLLWVLEQMPLQW